MHETAGIPEQVAKSVDLLLDSLSGLEVLIALYRSHRTWTPDQLASRLRMSRRAARLELERLSARGVVDSYKVKVGDDPIFFFRPADPTLAAHVARIADIYATRRIEIINHVAAGTLQRIRSG